MTASRRIGGRRHPFGSRLLGTSDQSARSLRVRVQLLLTALLISTNLISAVAVVIISIFVVPVEAPSGSMLVALAIAVPVYVGAAVLVGATVGTATSLRALRWAREDREPDAAERRTALRVPVRLTLLQGGMWLAATVLFTVLALILQPGTRAQHRPDGRDRRHRRLRDRLPAHRVHLPADRGTGARRRAADRPAPRRRGRATGW